MGIFDIFGASSILYIPGCFSSAKLKDRTDNYKKILKKIGINHTTLPGFTCCSGILINAGYDKEARKLARENLQLFQERGIKKIITSCPLCYKTLAYDYHNMLPDWDMEVEFILVTILNKLRDAPNLIRNPVEERIVYHDPCYLGRFSDIYNEPRELLRLLGYEIVELAYNKKDSLCSGSCGNLPITNKELANKIANDLIKYIKKTHINKIITPDPQSFMHLKDNLEYEDIRIFEFSEILCEVLGIRKS